MKKTIHQITAGFNKGDAISGEALALRDMFRGWGFESEIFSEKRRIPTELRSVAKDVTELQTAVKKNDVVLLHMSIGSDVNDVFMSLPCQKALRYHNITPPEYFTVINAGTAANLARGRKQLARLVGSASVNLADSTYNAEEMTALGYKNSIVLPIVMDWKRLAIQPDRSILKRYDDDVPTILFVGRCAPNKKIEDLVRCFYHYNKYVRPESRLLQVGSYHGTERYHNMILAMTRELGIQNRVTMTGSVTQAELNAYYRIADVFLCVSEHEGFCIPLIEGMFHNLPVLAYASSAVPGTLAGSGVLFKERDWKLVSEMLDLLIYDKTLRKSVLDGQQKRLKKYRNMDIDAEFREALSPLLSQK